MQHLAACTIREILSAKQGNQPIKIIAQDPIYCENCKQKIQDLDIEVVDDPEGFLRLTKNTFVLSIGPNVPVNQLVTDILYDAGGPAGMLTFEIEKPSDTEIEQCTDPWSPNVQAYADRCLGLKIGDPLWELDWYKEENPGEGWPVYTALAGTVLYIKRRKHIVKFSSLLKAKGA